MCETFDQHCSVQINYCRTWSGNRLFEWVFYEMYLVRNDTWNYYLGSFPQGIDSLSCRVTTHSFPRVFYQHTSWFYFVVRLQLWCILWCTDTDTVYFLSTHILTGPYYTNSNCSQPRSDSKHSPKFIPIEIGIPSWIPNLGLNSKLNTNSNWNSKVNS